MDAKYYERKAGRRFSETPASLLAECSEELSEAVGVLHADSFVPKQTRRTFSMCSRLIYSDALSFLGIRRIRNFLGGRAHRCYAACWFALYG